MLPEYILTIPVYILTLPEYILILSLYGISYNPAAIFKLLLFFPISTMAATPGQVTVTNYIVHYYVRVL